MEAVIESIQYDTDLWDSAIEYADHCSWSAGPYLAKNMRERIFTEWERVFVARVNESLAGFCTLAKTDCIPDVVYTPYIGFVFVDESYRGHRLSQKLIQCALEYAKFLGFSNVYLVSDKQGLYEKYGFVKIDSRKDTRGRDEQIFIMNI